MTAADTLPLERLGAARTEQLARISAAGLVERGQVFLLSLDAVRTEMGPRWPMRSEIIRETFERNLARAMPAPDVFVRVDDTTVLAAISSTDAYSGQMNCAKVLREALEFFLGRNQASDMSISSVSCLGPQAITADRIDPLAAPPVRSPPLAANDTARRPGPEAWSPPLSGRRSSLDLLTEKGGLVSVEVGVKPLWRLDRDIVGAYAVRPRLPAPFASFTDRDHEAIDACVADFLVTLLEDYRREGGVFAILCPFSFSTLSARSSRERLIQRCAPVLDVMKRAMILEIDGLSRGAPPSRIRETLSLCRPMTRVTTLAIRDPSAAEALAHETGADGAALDAEYFSQAQLASAITTARRRTSNIVVHGVPRSFDMNRLHALGASHATEAWSPPAGTSAPLAKAG